ncbi:hypothetical protein EK21DRAFT_76060, partial [Setomelanomma holmii]
TSPIENTSMIFPVLLVSITLVAQASAACTRTTLHAAVTDNYRALTTGDSSLISQAPNMTYIENDVPTNITQGILSQPITMDIMRSLLDTTLCATLIEITAASNAHPYVQRVL